MPFYFYLLRRKPTSMDSPRITNALVSVSDKLGLADFARGLAAAGVKITSTGGTRRHLESEGVEVHDVSAYTGFAEMMDGRLKTLHPKVFGGILCRHDNTGDMAALAEHQIAKFELVVVNLYPFEATVAREGVTEAEAIEQIDIGGPSLVRAAAKNHAFVTVATSSDQYAEILDQISSSGGTTRELRRRLAGEAFSRTAAYDRAIVDYFQCQSDTDEPAHTVNLTLRRKAALRYGENPHQQAALYSLGHAPGANLISAHQLSGKELSYNNLLDLDSALCIVRSLPHAAAVVIKHNNPCGAASDATLAEATGKALRGDPTSAFGSVLGLNRSLDVETAELLAKPGLFIEAIVAPDFEAPALEILTTRPKWSTNVRLIKVGPLDEAPSVQQYRWIDGGMLVQQADTVADPEESWKVVTAAQPADRQIDELRLAWAVVRHVKSNAIVLSQDQAVCGVGAGQMSRVDAVEIAIRKAGDRARGSVLASDAFFPFADSIQQAAQAGVLAVIQPGGSRRDQEVIDMCNEHGLSMIFTGRRYFKH